MGLWWYFIDLMQQSDHNCCQCRENWEGKGSSVQLTGMYDIKTKAAWDWCILPNVSQKCQRIIHVWLFKRRKFPDRCRAAARINRGTGDPRISWFHNSWSPLFCHSLLVKIS